MTASQLNFDLNAPPEPTHQAIEIDGMEVPLTEDGRLPYYVTARLMAGSNPTEEEAEFWDNWKDEMRNGGW